MSFFSKKSLGIDIGASSIKMVEISSTGKRKKLENYLEFNLPSGCAPTVKTFNPDNLFLQSESTAHILRKLFEKAGIKQKEVTFSLPDFSTFFTVFSLPVMSEQEIPQAVEFEARHHIPLLLSEVVFDWQILNRDDSSGKKMQVLLVAVPKNILKQYQKMANLSAVSIKGMEAEIFGLMRSSIPAGKEGLPICLIDFGWQSTTVSVVEKGNLLKSNSFDISGTSLTKAISDTLKVDLIKAEELKKKHGLDPQQEKIYKAISKHIDGLSLEIEKVLRTFEQNERKEIKDIVLAGGTASLFGLKEYLHSRLRKRIELANPFADISAPEILEERLKELGPSFAVALGVSIMGLEV